MRKKEVERGKDIHCLR